jgi:histidine triad (HIT) family protein
MTIALMTTKPFNIGHTLIIPKKHLISLKDLNDETAAHLFRITTHVADAIRRSGLRCDGINFLLNDGEPFQEILHLHFHVFPRFRGDKIRLERDETLRPSRDELDDTAKIIHDVF